MLISDNVSSARPMKEIRRADEDGICTITDSQWENPASLFAVQDAVANYAILLHHLWPLDQSALILNKVLVKYRWLSQADNMKVRADMISQFFNGVLRANSRRAANKEATLSFAEQEAIMKSTLAKHGLSAEASFQAQPAKRGDKGQKGPSQQPPRQRNSPIYFNNKKVCFAFNNTEGRDCRSTPTATGCKDKAGNEYAHVCSRYLPDKQKHCFMSHRRRDHK